MQTLVEAASHIAQEIERTRQHLTNLEQALEGLRPLITIDAATTTLPFTATPLVQAVEDASIVNAKVPAKKVIKAKRIAKTQSAKITSAATPVKVKVAAETKAAAKAGTSKKGGLRGKELTIKSTKLPSTGAKLWLNCLGRKKLSTTELVEAALKKLGLDASARVVIANRARAWINASVRSGVVIAAGTRDGTHLYKRVLAK
jgi:hypothetical protein